MKPVSYTHLIQDGKIEGAKPERVVYFQAPDDSMRAMRIEKGDLVLVVPQALPVDLSLIHIFCCTSVSTRDRLP